MKVIIFLVVLVTMATSTVIKTNEGEITPLARLIGSVNGTMYFADSSEVRSWEGAKSYCQGAGMQMAKIETYHQSYMLYKAYNATNFEGEFWVAGRDALKATQFVWDDTKATPEPYFNELLYIKPEFKFQTCVYFKEMISHNILGVDLCTASKQTLCSIDTHIP